MDGWMSRLVGKLQASKRFGLNNKQTDGGWQPDKPYPRLPSMGHHSSMYMCTHMHVYQHTHKTVLFFHAALDYSGYEEGTLWGYWRWSQRETRETYPSVLVIVAAVMKYQDQGSIQKDDFIWAHVSRRRVHNGRGTHGGGHTRKARDYTFSHMQKAESKLEVGSKRRTVKPISSARLYFIKAP